MTAQLHTTNSSDPLLPSAVHRPGARKRGVMGRYVDCRVWVSGRVLEVIGDPRLWYCFNSWHWERKGLRACMWGVQSGLGQGFCVFKCVPVWVCVFAGSVPVGPFQTLWSIESLALGVPSTNSNYHQITEIMGDPAVKNLTSLTQTLSLLLFLPRMAILQPSSY